MTDLVKRLRDREIMNGYLSDQAPKMMATMEEAADHIAELTAAVQTAHTELAALIRHPSKPTTQSWPVENPADAECLQRAYVALSI